LKVKGKLRLEDAKTVDSSARLDFNDADIRVEELHGKGAKLLNDTLGRIHSFKVDVTAQGDWVAPVIKVRSDIDQKLSRAFKKVMAKEIARYKKELKVLLEKELKKQSAKLKKMTRGIIDIGPMIDGDMLSIEALQKKAKALLDTNNAKALATQKAKEQANKYLHDKEARDKAKNRLKKLFHR